MGEVITLAFGSEETFMNNNQLYDSVFLELFELHQSNLNSLLVYQSVEPWDSVGHMELISKLEEVFNINLEMDDVIDFSSYTEGKKILSKYGVHLDESL
jgi:acyl carrier protein